MLKPKWRSRIRDGTIAAPRPTQTSNSGGESETDDRALTVMPSGVPEALREVSTQTPVAK